MFRLALAAVGLTAATLPAADVAAYPATVRLTGAGATQQVVVAQTHGGRATADVTGKTAFRSADDKVATVSPTGVVTAVGNGSTTVTAGAVEVPVTVAVSSTPAAPSFRHAVEPVLTRTGCNSGACHGALAGKGGFKLSLRGYDPDADHHALTRQALARRVDGAAPADSLVLKKATRAVPHGGGTRFDDDSAAYRTLLAWAAAGAPGPSSADATLTRLDIAPPLALLKPKDTLRLVVTATYSDGTVRDVTPWAKFTSSEEPTAAVDEDGVVTVAGPGEAGVAALFGSKVALARVTVPFPTPQPAGAFARLQPGGFIDELILAKLKLLNLPPSGVCTDAEFIRRSSLDACGVLPAAADVAAFVADTRPDKRARLVNTLLSQPAYVDYWAHKWSDLLLVSSRKLPPPAVWAFYRGVRRAVADDVPWDQFARGILTSTGGTLDAGGANYFVLHKDVPDLAESTAVTFLGLSVNCCRCHNHPLEKWTQDQYWGQANLFSRVGLKAGAAGETIVTTRPAGDALHPRTGKPVPPTPLDGKPLLDDAADRRAYYADWLTGPDNPYFAKAIVNRVWRNYMGRGLVEAEDDLRETNPPTNPELLDALAKDFRDHGYDVKRLARLIMTSASYQRSAGPVPGNAADDRYYSRYLVRRLSAEVILDGYADLTGVPTPFDSLSRGPSESTVAAMVPAGTRAIQLPDSQLVSRFLDAFGRAERLQTCACEKTSDASVGQALHLNNGKTLNDKLRDPKSTLSKWLAAGTPDGQVLDELFPAALSRPPSAGERAKFLAALAAAGAAGRREALEDVVWAVLTGREFLFNH